MVPQWIIEKKRDGRALADEEIGFFIQGYASGVIPDYQMAALAMAITLQGMSPDETVALTRNMLASGITLDTSSLRNPKIDKHSTGGIGDKVSLVLAPLVACCGIAVPMIAGRGLGLTGGTIDKLESIPGYRTHLDEAAFLHVLHTCGCSIIRAMDNLVPADNKLYALRDVTGTVPSIPLIVSSILSKKLAAQPDGLVLDVKWGHGAFMTTRSGAEALTRALVTTGRRLDLRMAALLTDMNQPLGRAVGNSLEVAESVDVLRGNGPADVVALTLELGVRMLMMGHVAADRKQALERLRAKLQSGEAFERLKTMVRLHGGDPRALDDPARLPSATIREPLPAHRAGFIQTVDAEAIGRAALLLGAGRARVTDKVDPTAGIAALKKIGEVVTVGETLAILHTNRRDRLEEARALSADAFRITVEHVSPPPLIALEI
ncbi:MAG: thymidine phosphorylase [Verrucomicrobia bacterium]|nr:thymidine phosphorylase [Verrucomicrobiota bacterium]MBU4285354.1 thymidine phosphorylase [Verrucomicrobiota bacterium]MBU4366332.1 thymidine phosphorylase [Verrucomicrobiota bacterium]